MTTKKIKAVKKSTIETIADLKPAPYNPRVISEEALRGLKKSLSEFGDLSGITFNTRTGHLVSGHQRVRALQEQHGDLAIQHDRVTLPDGNTLPVRLVDWDVEKEKLANLAANNPHIQGDWSGEIEALLRDLPAGELFDDLNLDQLLEEVRAPVLIEATEDGAPEHAPKRAQEGDIWLLGGHRLLCGDSTNREAVARLFGPDAPFIMVTDPPYGVKYDPAWRNDHAESANYALGKVQNDDRVDWQEAYELFPGDVAYVWHASSFAIEAGLPLQRAGFELRYQLIWKKQHFAFSRGNYHWQHEPCWYGVRKGHASKWTGDRKQSTIWEIANSNPHGGKQDDMNTFHSTQKPVECMLRPIKNHGRQDDHVYDPFLGSGTTLIAAEQVGRRCFGVELNPEYCDIIIERWQRFTGGKAKKA